MPLHKPQKTMILCTAFIAGCGAYFLNSVPLLAVISVLLISLLTYKKIFSIKFSVLCLIVLAFSVFYCGFRCPKPDELYKISPLRSGSEIRNGDAKAAALQNKLIPANVYL